MMQKLYHKTGLKIFRFRSFSFKKRSLHEASLQSIHVHVPLLILLFLWGHDALLQLIVIITAADSNP